MIDPQLNREQQQAVEHDRGPILVVAGAGSGKTRVITRRIAHLIQHRGVHPQNILAITFTNKAAKEMRERVFRMLENAGEPPWISTFHAFCLRVLRRSIEPLGYRNDFVIYDTQDQLSLIKQCMKLARINEDSFAPKTLLNHISGFKNDFRFPEDVDPETFTFGNQMKAAELYPVYQNELKKNQGLDFDDLLIQTVRLFKEHPNVSDFYNRQFQHILVDEFQDTNKAQYHLIQLLTRNQQNICVVGDDDQSIYRWRGANLDNILNFERDYAGAKVVKLEENYRSTQTILKAAGAVVKENVRRKEKTLWTRNAEGAPVTYYRSESESDEARAVCEKAMQLNRDEGVSFSDMAVLYRTNAQSRVMEDELRQQRIPYQVIGGLKFYERKEIKDLLAFMRVIVNPDDSVSLRRIINVPPRGIGKTSLDKVIDYAESENIPLMQALQVTEERRVTTPAAAKKITLFIRLLQGLEQVYRDSSLHDFLEQILQRTGYAALLEKEGSKESVQEGKARMENIMELFSAIDQFEQDQQGGLQEFLDTTTLSADIDNLDDSRGVLPLMTLHTCKGLEFDAVFIIGMENGLLPHASSMNDTEEYEEERRLCYVGFTRARKILTISNARQRRIYGNVFTYQPSDFLLSIPPELLQKESSTPTPAFVPSGRAPFQDPYFQSPPVEFKPASSQGEFPVGTKVVHPKFGSGIVVNREGKGDNLKVVVFFQKAGKKKLAVSHANLVVL